MTMTKMKMIKTIASITLTANLIWMQGCSSSPEMGLHTEMHVPQPTELMLAAKAGDYSKVDGMVGSDTNLNVASPEGSVLSMAVSSDNAKLVLLLLKQGANPNFGTPKGGYSSIMIAADNGNTRIAKMLLASGADVNYTDSKGDAAVSLAVYKGHLTTAKALIKAGADVNIEPNGSSLLMHTVEGNDLLLSQVLIAAGADVNFKTTEGMSALKIAKEKHLRDLNMLLVQSGAKQD